MECQHIIRNVNSKDKDDKNFAEFSSDDNDAKKLKEIVSISSEDSIAEAASKHIEETLNRLKHSAPTQSTETNDFVKPIDNEKNDCITDEKTELDRRVRAGEITPFQAAAAINNNSSNSTVNQWGATKTAGLLGLEHYLKRQAELLEQRKKLKGKKIKKPEETSKKSEKTKRKFAVDDFDNSLKKKPKIVVSISANNESSQVTEKTNEQSSPKNTITQQDNAEINECVKINKSYSPEIGSHDSGSEYIPTDGELTDSDIEINKRKFVKAVKKKRKKEKNPECESSVWKKKRVFDDGDESMYQERMEYKVNTIRRKKKKDGLFTVENLFKVPKSIWKRLYEYQRVSVRWLWELHGRDLGGLVGDEMGLGKTVQVIAFLAGLDASELLSDGGRFRGLGPTLIICPATLLEQWVKHFQEWCPTLRVVILHHSGTYRGEPEDLIESIKKTGGIVLTSYSGVLGYKQLLIHSQWHYVILDEGHKIRNPEAKVTKAVKLFSTPHRLILTGSPMQNSLKELWSLFDFILPGKLGTLPTFLEHCANPITRGGYANASPLQEATALQVATMLKDAIAPYMLRRTKNDVQHHISLPEKNEQVLFCSLTEEQTNLYKDYLRTEHVSSVLHDKSSCSENSYRARLLVALTSLRKICNHPDLYTFGNVEADSEQELNPTEEVMEKFGDWKRSGKLSVVRSLLKIWKRQGHRVILFTQGRQMMGVLEALVQREGYEYLRLDGTTPMSQRQHTIHKFNNDVKYFVFVSTTRVGGLGINLTGANRVVIYDPDWNPAVDAQARERAWRIGQDKRVTIYRLITAGTVEEKIYHRQIFKVLLSNRILENPRQRRLFQTSDLSELFNLNVPIDGKTTESDRIFSNCKLKPTVPSFSQSKLEAMKKLASTVSKRIGKKNETTTKAEENKEKVMSLRKTEKIQVSKKFDEQTEKFSAKLTLVSSDDQRLDFATKINVPEEAGIKTTAKLLPELHETIDEILTKSQHIENDELEQMEILPSKFQRLEENLRKNDINETETRTNESSPSKIEQVEKKRKKKSHKKNKKRDKFDNETSAIFEGEKVPCLLGRRLASSEQKDEAISSTCDDQYVLMKLFSKTNVSSAYQHDAVLGQANMGGDQINPMHRMARDVAEESMDIIRKSRKWCWRPTWDTPKRDDE